MLLLGDYAYAYVYDNELWSSWSSVMSSCVARYKKNHDVSKERSASEVLECTYQVFRGEIASTHISLSTKFITVLRFTCSAREMMFSRVPESEM